MDLLFFSLRLIKYHFFYLILQPQPLQYPNPIVRKDSHGLEKPQVIGCVLITKAFMRLVSKTSESRTFCEYRHCESPGVWNGHVWFSRFIICTKLTNLTTPIKTLENQKSR